MSKQHISSQELPKALVDNASRRGFDFAELRALALENEKDVLQIVAGRCTFLREGHGAVGTNEKQRYGPLIALSVRVKVTSALELVSRITDEGPAIVEGYGVVQLAGTWNGGASLAACHSYQAVGSPWPSMVASAELTLSNEVRQRTDGCGRLSGDGPPYRHYREAVYRFVHDLDLHASSDDLSRRFFVVQPDFRGRIARAVARGASVEFTIETGFDSFPSALEIDALIDADGTKHHRRMPVTGAKPVLVVPATITRFFAQLRMPRGNNLDVIDEVDSEASDNFGYRQQDKRVMFLSRAGRDTDSAPPEAALDGDLDTSQGSRMARQMILDAKYPHEFWHVRVVFPGGKGRGNYAVINDMTFDAVQKHVVEPSCSSRPFAVAGAVVNKWSDVAQIQIVQTPEKRQHYAKAHDERKRAQGIVDLATDRRLIPFSVGTDYTNELLFTDTAAAPSSAQAVGSTRGEPAPAAVFLVHGRNEGVRETVARFIERLGIEVIILHERPDRGLTIIEKFEQHASEASFAVVLLTGDDRGGLRDEQPDTYRPRARQNVMLELGFFLGTLGRSNVCALYENGVVIPSDYSGVLFVPIEDHGAWQTRLAREMKAAGLPVDLNKLA